IGIAWLPILFGPYFAMKLAAAGEGPVSNGKAIGAGFAGLIVFATGGFLFQKSMNHPSGLTLLGFIVMLASAFVPLFGWRSLTRALLDYALAARLPVLVVMYFAMAGNNGAGWGTHYDAAPPALAHLPLSSKYILAAVIPQLTVWIGWTSVLGAICGGITAAVTRR